MTPDVEAIRRLYREQAIAIHANACKGIGTIVVLPAPTYFAGYSDALPREQSFLFEVNVSPAGWGATSWVIACQGVICAAGIDAGDAESWFSIAPRKS